MGDGDAETRGREEVGRMWRFREGPIISPSFPCFPVPLFPSALLGLVRRKVFLIDFVNNFQLGAEFLITTKSNLVTTLYQLTLID